jgi:plasmid maintenance system killer protein
MHLKRHVLTSLIRIQVVIHSGKEQELSLIPTVLRKLDYLNKVKMLNDLEAQIPERSYRLEALKGDLKAKDSIWINDQFQIVFQFSDSEASGVDNLENDEKQNADDSAP